MSYLEDIQRWPGFWGPNSLRAFAYLRPERWSLLAIAAIALVYLPGALLEPYVLLYLVDEIILAEATELLPGFMLRVIPLLLIVTTSEFLMAYALLQLSRKLHRRIKSVQLDNLLEKSANFFRNTASGKVLFAFLNDSSQLGAALSVVMINAILNAVLLAVRVGILAYVSVPLTLLYLVGIVPLQSWALFRVTREAIRLEIQIKQTDEELTARLESMLRGMVTIKALGFGGPLASIWKRVFGRRLDLDLENMMWKQLGSLAVITLQGVAVFGVLFIGVYQIAELGLTLGALLAFVSVTGRIAPSLQAMVGVVVGTQETLVNIERYFRVLDLAGEKEEFCAAGAEPGIGLTADDVGDIEVTEISVIHGPGRVVSIPCKFSLRSGESYLWYGPNGSGKTSVGLGLGGVIPHVPGSIGLRSGPLSRFSPASIREVIRYVGAQPFWPERTLEQNFCNSLALSESESIDVERFEWALDVCDARSVFETLPAGLQTVLSDEANMLSRGENQRLFLAMVLYTRPRVLILDEALSNVTAHSVRRIVSGLSEWQKGGATVVYVSHRPELFGPPVVPLPFGRLG